LVLSFPAGKRTRLPSVDVNQPLPLPLLAQPVPDRAPLDDATGEASHTAALAAAPPRRGTPAPFLRLGLPDPFENRLPPRATMEEVLPAPGPSRLPKP
jgi:hypothetical protein